MKIGLIAVAAALIILIGVVIGRALIVTPPQVAHATKPEVVVDSIAAAQHLAQAIRFQTISFGNGIKEDEKNAQLDAMRAWMEKTYPNFHHAASREIVGESLLFTWKGKNPNLSPILLMAHMDVVPVVPGTEKNWTHQPFSGDIAGGYVWGRGAIDDKGCLISILEAADKLAASGFTPARTIMFAFGQDEEVGGAKGNAAIAKMLALRGVHFSWVLDEGGAIVDDPPGISQPVTFVDVAEKGYLSVRLVAHGEGGHSSRPTKDMAIVRVSQAVLNVMDHPFASGLDDIQREKLSLLAPLAPFGNRLALANLWLSAPLVEDNLESTPDGAGYLHTTIAPTMFNAGVKDNVIPPDATATINFRLHPRDSIASVIAHVKKAIDDPKVDVIALTESQSEASKVADFNGPSYEFLKQTIEESFGVPVVPDTLGAATDSRHYLAIADNIFRLDPFHFKLTDFPRVHGTNERLAVKDIAPAASFYARLMHNAR
ncbi:MAG TPA: M20 family peptidase [Rhizomicrobium sp.]|jgi:carboxypeptidase PM20D1|nr:M20 family peptidase [Rhizomicrobium sp.]